MFQLIVAVISIALIAALAIASIFYGGDAFTKSSEKATVTTLINQAQQIAGAAALYKTDSGVRAQSITDLDGSVANSVQYLSQIPGGTKVTNNDTAAAGGWQISTDGYAYIPFLGNADTVSICEEVVKQRVGVCFDGTDYGTAVVPTASSQATGFALSL
ncbi:hypothetical protein [Mesorhizobium sp. SP-1A]|uniref:hypothetical protein n=1 Tax=Mesorhizobium sp. SP-1A TaxID=3077840 RepID=UPI0028F71FFE|nr:hypothetical protein [Mesorhizobium sp. SP-1A]